MTSTSRDSDWRQAK